MSKRALMVYDVEKWAQYNFAAGVQKFAPEGFKVDICDAPRYLNGMTEGERKLYDGILTPLFASYKKPGCRRLVTLLASHALMFERYDPSDYRTLGVTNDRHRKHARKILNRADAAIARNRELAASLGEYHGNIVTIPAGVDTDVFNLTGRQPNASGPLKVGWCGNKGCKLGRNFKGFDKILQPLMEICPQYDWQVNTRDYTNALSQEEMADWFRTLDVFITTASAEGTPNPPFTAAACGCYVIATDVGQLTDWPYLRQSSFDFIVPTYRNEAEAKTTIQAFRQRLEKANKERAAIVGAGLMLHRDILARYSYRHISPRVLEFVTGP